MTVDELKLRLREAMAAEPVLIGERGGFQTFRRADLLFAVPSLPDDADPWALAAVAAARTAFIGRGCQTCGARPHVRARDHSVAVIHASSCPARQVATFVPHHSAGAAGPTERTSE